HEKGRVYVSVDRVEAPRRREEGAARIELLDAVVVRIGDVDVPAPVGRHAKGIAERSVDRAGTPPREEEGTARIELLDAVVARICDVDVPARVGRHARRPFELSVARARQAPLQKERTQRDRGRGRAEGGGRGIGRARGRAGGGRGGRRRSGGGRAARREHWVRTGAVRVRHAVRDNRLLARAEVLARQAGACDGDLFRAGTVRALPRRSCFGDK